MKLFLFYLLFFTSGIIRAQKITYGKWEKLVPSERLPDSLHIRSSNNNLDITRYHGKYYFVFRTAPSHFASSKTTMYVLSSTNLQSWKFEKKLYHGNDLREPRFNVYDGKLFLYYFEGGKMPFRFQPKHLWACEYDPATGWTDPKSTGLDGFVPWRLRTWNDTIYLSAYYGAGLYSADHQANLRLFTSTNGFDWAPLSEAPQVSDSDGEEGEFIFDDDGNLWGTVRLESTGALIVYADKDNIGRWQTKYTKYKYDSALMFKHNNEIYLISRRNVDGEIDKAPKWFSESMRKYYNLFRYSVTKKKTALFKMNQQKKELVHLMDFPSTGDTAFPGITQINKNQYLLMNYSSNIYDIDRNWISGQLGNTYIYWTILTFEEGNTDVTVSPNSK